MRRRRPLFADGDVVGFDQDYTSSLEEFFNPEGVEDPLGLDEEGRELIVPAPNAIEWVIGREWCNSPSVFEHVRQYQIIRDFFELRCPVCNSGTSDPGQPGDLFPGGVPRTQEYMENEVLLVWDADNGEDTCPKCGSTRQELVESDLFWGHNQLHIVAGQRSGKSFTSGFIGTYIEHRILTLAHGTLGGLHGYLHLQPAEQFEITFLAANEVQSADTIWTKFFELRSQSPWFQRYRRWISQQAAIQERPKGAKRWRYEEQTKVIINEHPKIRLKLNSLNSNSAGLRGRTRLGAFADEISHMQQTDSAQGADEVYRALENSLATVRGSSKAFGLLPWLGAMVSITSPKDRDDKGMRLLEAAPKIKKMYSGHYETWAFNPHFTEDDFEEVKEKDPVGWRRDFKADPPGASNPLIHDEHRFRKLVINSDLVPTATFRTEEFDDPTGQRYIAAMLQQASYTFDNFNRYVVFDSGLKFDAFAGACAHGEMREDEEGNPRVITVFDWIIRILPEVGMEVHFDSVVTLIRELRKFHQIARVEFDRWNSVQLIQQIRQMGIPSEQKPTKDQDYIDFKIAAFSGLIEMLPPTEEDWDEEGKRKVDPPFLTAQACAIYEIEGLEHNIDTNKVTNPKKGERRGWNSNDVAQCAVHAHRLVQTEGYTAKFADRSREARRRNFEAGTSGWHRRGIVANPVRTPGGGVAGGFRNWSGNARGW